MLKVESQFSRDGRTYLPGDIFELPAGWKLAPKVDGEGKINGMRFVWEGRDSDGRPMEHKETLPLREE